MSALKQFEQVWTRENATTRKVLHAIPDDQAEFKTSPNVKAAREVAHIFSMGQGAMLAALDGSWKFPPSFPKAPATLAEVRKAFDESTKALQGALAKAKEARMDEKVMFMTGPKQPGEMSVSTFCWFMLLDTIHHRGQLSIYLRAMGAKVPSIYGPSADEPWM
ncbi:MAG: DinB family protein [Gemmatimonadales bacterium]|nr:DinB family protein [Gemmatimonadales bacterium]